MRSIDVFSTLSRV
jgi:hypothetical protein